MSRVVVKQILEFVQKYHLVDKKEKLVVAVSGGADSMALLHVLCEMSPELEIQISVAHFNHLLRGKESDEDMVFVQDRAQHLGLSFFSAKEDIRIVSKSERLSLEDAARRARYDFFLQVAEMTHARKIVVGHTCEDQAETLLLHILRGVGMEGLEGTKPLRPLGECTVIRPLLETSRKDLKYYLKDKNLSWREDASNNDLSFTRNRIRKLLIPLLEKEFNPEIIDGLCRLSRIVEKDNHYLRLETENIFRRWVKSFGRNLCLKLELLRTLDMALQRRLVRKMFSVLNSLENLSFNHVERIFKFLNSSQSGRGIFISKRIEVWTEFDRFFMGRRMSEDVFSPQVIEVPGTALLSGKWVSFRIKTRRLVKDEISNLSHSRFSAKEIWNSIGNGGTVEFCEYFDGDQIRDSFLVRGREAGDYYDPMGLKGYKRVKDIFIDEKVPLRFRSRVPVFVSEGKIFWIAGFRTSESFKVRSESRQILEVQLRMEGGMDA